MCVISNKVIVHEIQIHIQKHEICGRFQVLVQLTEIMIQERCTVHVHAYTFFSQYITSTEYKYKTSMGRSKKPTINVG